MAISFVGSDQAIEVGSDTNSLALTLPTHQTDDFGIIIAKEGLGTTPVMAVTVATGWTKLRNDTSGSGRVQGTWIWYKKFTSASETNPTITIDTAAEKSATVHVFRGVDTTTAFDVTEVYSSGTNNVQAACPAITPTTANGALILVQGMSHDDITTPGLPTTPTSLTLGEAIYGGANDDCGLIIAYKVDYGAATTQTPSAWTHSFSIEGVADWAVYSLALRPASASSIIPQAMHHYRQRRD